MIAHAKKVHPIARSASKWGCVGATLWLLALGGCPNPVGPEGDPNLGPIDDTVTRSDRINWPGVDTGRGREIPFIRGFANGAPNAYWFLGFASKRSADSFWFCREGDESCPLDEHRRLNWDTLVGNPLFMRIPGQAGFSPFWQMWVVRVPDDYEADSVKTIETLHEMDLARQVHVEPFILDFGEIAGTFRGPQEVLLHCALVLRGTILAENGDTLPDGSGPMLVMENHFGWHEGFEVEFVDFSPSDGVFPEDVTSDSRPLMPFGKIYIHWRWCDRDPVPEICDIPGFALGDRRPVSERGLGQDVTGDDDPNDTNNTLGALPCDLQREGEPPYSPLWQPNAVFVPAEVGLVDTYRSQNESDIQSVNDIFAGVEAGLYPEPVPQSEDSTGNPFPGNEGVVFFNCPVPVSEGNVPYPCTSR